MGMKHVKMTIRLISTAALLLACLWVTPVHAQTPTLSVDPQQTVVPVGTEFVLELKVTGGDEVNAFDVTVNYDSYLLTLINWAHGDYLSNLALMTVVNEEGVLQVAATQLATEAASGDGVLLRLFFRSDFAGANNVEIVDATFANPQGVKAFPELENGTVEGIAAPTYTPTATATATPTITRTPFPTNTFTPLPSPTQTATFVPTDTLTPQPTATYTFTPGVGDLTETTSPTVEGAEGSGAVPTQVDEASAKLTSVAGTPGEAGVTDSAELEEEDRADEPALKPETPTQNWLSVLLWVVWGISAVVLVLMIVILIKRNKKKEESLLL